MTNKEKTKTRIWTRIMVTKQTKSPYQALHIFHVESILWQWNELQQKGKAPGKSISDDKIQKFCINISKSF